MCIGVGVYSCCMHAWEGVGRPRRAKALHRPRLQPRAPLTSPSFAYLTLLPCRSACISPRPLMLPSFPSYPFRPASCVDLLPSSLRLFPSALSVCPSLTPAARTPKCLWTCGPCACLRQVGLHTHRHTETHRDRQTERETHTRDTNQSFAYAQTCAQVCMYQRAGHRGQCFISTHTFKNASTYAHTYAYGHQHSHSENHCACVSVSMGLRA